MRVVFGLEVRKASRTQDFDPISAFVVLPKIIFETIDDREIHHGAAAVLSNVEDAGIHYPEWTWQWSQTME